jgi:hypothetical protein
MLLCRPACSLTASPCSTHSCRQQCQGIVNRVPSSRLSPRLCLTSCSILLSLQEESESRELLFRDCGDPMAGFTAQLMASITSLVLSVQYYILPRQHVCLIVDATSNSVSQGLDEAVSRIFTAIDIDMTGSFGPPLLATKHLCSLILCFVVLCAACKLVYF